MARINEIIGNAIKIQNLEVAENDFSQTMFWDDAKIACAELGNGWRLPTKEELKFLYKLAQKNNARNFSMNRYYWSGTIYDGKIAIPFTYSLAGPFSDGIAAVEINQQYLTFIDKTGNVVINKKFYTKKRGVKGLSIYHDGDGDGHPGKYINGKIFIRYFDNDGYGKRVFALVDRKGNVFKKTTSEKYFEDPVFKKYLDVEE